MKRVLPILALGLLAGCATYPDYGYYDDGRTYDGYTSDGYYDDRYREGGDYYYSTRPNYYDDGGYYGYGPYSGGYGYGGYGGYGYGGYGNSLGYGLGYGSRIGLGFGFSSGSYYPYGGNYGRYPYGGYYGGYPYGYSGYNSYYSPRRHYRYDRYNGRGNNDPWLDARNRYGTRGDGVVDRDASDLANDLARQRGVRDGAGTPAGDQRTSSYAFPSSRNARDRDPTPYDRNGWRSDYRDAQLASPRSAASGDAYSRDSSAPQLRMEQAPASEWRGQSRQPQGYAAQRFDSAPRSQNAPAPRFEAAPQRFSQPSVAPRVESRSNAGSQRSSARERDATNDD